MKKYILIPFIFLLSACSLKHAKPVCLFNTENRLIRSEKTLIDYKLSVSLPEGYWTSNEKYPVLYLLDPDDSFAMAHDIARNLAGFSDLKKIIVVGIGYKHQSKEKMSHKDFWLSFAKNRARDYVPFSIVKGIDKFEGGGGANTPVLRKLLVVEHVFMNLWHLSFSPMSTIFIAPAASVHYMAIHKAGSSRHGLW